MNEKIFTIPEVAEYLKLSKSKVYRMVQMGMIPHIRIGRNVRIMESDLMKWLEKSQAVSPTSLFLFPSRIR
jgi:excisionase family DNA binding protein